MGQSGSFREILRTCARHPIYDCLERSHGIEREEIPAKLELFHEALIPSTGAGGNLVERLMAKDLYGQLGIVFSLHQEWALVDYVSHALKSAMIAPIHNSSLK